MNRDESGRFSKAHKRTLEGDVADIFWMVSELKRDLKAMRGEISERLRVIELHVEILQGSKANAINWTKEQRQAFLDGLQRMTLGRYGEP